MTESAAHPNMIASLIKSAALAVLLFAGPVAASVPQPPLVANSIAVQIKPEKLDAKELDRLAATGIKTVRMGMWWNNVEDEGGVYRWDKPVFGGELASYEAAIAALRKRDITVMVTLRMGHRNYTGPARDFEIDGRTKNLIPAPHDDKGIEGFASFAANTAAYFSEKYGADAFRWIVWNEPNLAGFWPPKPDAVLFTRLLNSACHAIKQAVPGAVVYGPGLAYEKKDIDWEFLKVIAQQPQALACLDALTIHPYGPAIPERTPESYEALRNFLREQTGESIRQLPIAVDELGYSLWEPNAADKLLGRSGLNADAQADHIWRTFIVNIAYGLPFTVWYEYKDSGADIAEREHGFGLIDSLGTAKPALTALETFLREFGNLTFAERLSGDGCYERVHVYAFHDPRSIKRTKLAAWVIEGEATLAIQTAGNIGSRPTVRDVLGKTVTDEKNPKTVRLSRRPVAVSGLGEPGAALRIACE